MGLEFGAENMVLDEMVGAVIAAGNESPEGWMRLAVRIEHLRKCESHISVGHFWW